MCARQQRMHAETALSGLTLPMIARSLAAIVMAGASCGAAAGDHACASSSCNPSVARAAPLPAVLRDAAAARALVREEVRRVMAQRVVNFIVTESRRRGFSPDEEREGKATPAVLRMRPVPFHPHLCRERGSAPPHAEVARRFGEESAGLDSPSVQLHRLRHPLPRPGTLAEKLS